MTVEFRSGVGRHEQIFNHPKWQFFLSGFVLIAGGVEFIRKIAIASSSSARSILKRGPSGEASSHRFEPIGRIVSRRAPHAPAAAADNLIQTEIGPETVMERGIRQFVLKKISIAAGS
jgi:hypothetical protein